MVTSHLRVRVEMKMLLWSVEDLDLAGKCTGSPDHYYHIHRQYNTWILTISLRTDLRILHLTTF